MSTQARLMYVASPGCEMLGTVQRSDEIGALARNLVTGSLVMLRASAASMLDQRKAKVALSAVDKRED